MNIYKLCITFSYRCILITNKVNIITEIKKIIIQIVCNITIFIFYILQVMTFDDKMHYMIWFFYYKNSIKKLKIYIIQK